MEPKKTPDEWAEEMGIQILDPDGWRGKDDPPYSQPLTWHDFYERMTLCTIRHVPPKEAL